MHYNFCWPGSLGSFLVWLGGWGDAKLQLTGVGKFNVWVLELNFAGPIMNFIFLF